MTSDDAILTLTYTSVKIERKEYIEYIENTLSKYMVLDMDPTVSGGKLIFTLCNWMLEVWGWMENLTYFLKVRNG